MTREESLQKMRDLGFIEATMLRTEAAEKTITETEIIERETAAPRFDPNKDYTGWPINSPVRDEGQVWLLIIPHNASHYPGRPSSNRALWGLAHTKDASKAKPYVAPFGTSGLYMIDECCVWTNGSIYKSIIDNNAYDPEAYPDGWEEVSV